MKHKADFPEIDELYRRLDAPIADLDCGKKCGPLNLRGAPFCCDTRHCVPAAYPQEWDHLQRRTGLWHRWHGEEGSVRRELEDQVQEGQVLLECLGHRHCQRAYRTLACRMFPFYPYLDSGGHFLGLGVLYEYRDRCWVISHLEVVSDEYIEQFMDTCELLFEKDPDIKEHYRQYAASERTAAQRDSRRLTVLRRAGRACWVDPEAETLTEIPPEKFPMYEPYLTRENLLFPDER